MPAGSTRPSLKQAWLAGSEELLPYCGFHPYKPDWADILAARAAQPLNRTLLASTLLSQYAGFPAEDAVLSNIESLRSENTFAVTTGQQPGLFGGPLYTLYKALSAIKLADFLQNKFPDKRFVPLFWVASEDHDIEEVNHCYTAYNRRVDYPGLFPGPVGRQALSDVLQEVLAMYPYLADCYVVGESWGNAFRRLLHKLLGRYGLVVLEPDTAALKAAFADVIRRELAETGTEAAVRHTTAELEALGYRGQIHPRSVNLFFLQEGRRLRLDRNHRQELLVVEGTEGDQAALQSAIAERRWEDFSPNVVLRPVYQETIVPSVAYIGGWAEVSYWLQLKGVFQRYDRFLPVVLPRAGALILREEEANALNDLGLTLDELLQPDASLRIKLGQQRWDGSLLQGPLMQIQAAYQSLEDAVGAIDKGQLHNLKGAAVKTNQFFERLEAKLRRALLHQHTEWTKPVFALKAGIQPQGHLQERTLNWLAYGAEEPTAFIEWLYQVLEYPATHLQVCELPTVLVQPTT